MPVTRIYSTGAMRRRPKDVVTPKDVLKWWQEAHEYLKVPSRERFLRHPATRQLCGYPLLAVKQAVATERKLDKALERVQRVTRGYNTSTANTEASPAAKPASPRSRSTWLGGDVTDFETEQQWAAERQVARLEVDRPEPYL